ncbi:MAG: chemotaxis protein CheX [Helicobacteraceae bacterium]|jgi:CheY-specific phosphatase CheX|nr:chemotaxis protein CheX [Helicobacteraceae bacterium]
MSLEEALIEAAEHFAKETLGCGAKLTASTPRKRAWTASVDAIGDKKWSVKAHAPKPVLKQMAKLFLNEESPSDDDLRDLIGEIANLVAGRAKAVASDRGLQFDISPPRFEGKSKPIAKDADINLHFAFADDVFTISASCERQ